jgi:alkylhydroperoxidase family enzyme
VIERPEALTKSCTPKQAAIVELVRRVTRAPWDLSRAHRARANTDGLDDDAILHVVLQAAYFGHLNRIADATGVPLDYEVQLAAEHADPSAPALPPAPRFVTGRPAIDLSRRPTTQAALSEWRRYLIEKDAPLSRRQRTLIARWVATWLGDGGISSPIDVTANRLDAALQTLAETVTLAPWQLTDASFAALRDEGFDDAALFDVCATASSATMFSRIEVALAALAI